MFYLETPRLVLRLFQESDAADLFRIEGNPDVMRYIRPPAVDASQSLARIQQEIIYNQSYPGLGLCACFEKENETYIGLAKIKHIDPTDDIEVGYAFVPEAWGKGYATELTKAAIEYLQTNFASRRIIAFIQAENANSRKVLEKSGMKEITSVYPGREEAVVFEYF